VTAVEHRFGPYGGQYVPETLMPALAELEAAWIAARDDEGYRTELDTLRRDYCGRPTPVYHAERLSALVGHAVWLKREDLMHTGSHKLNNALGQCLLAKRMGKPRIIAETGAGQHGVATATACALLGLECVVYMGTEDMRRQMPNVQRMRLLGATVAGVDAGSRTLKEAVSAAIRDWVANVGNTHYAIGSCVGPAPFPALVRDLQRIIGDEARAQILERAGRLPQRVIACVGGGSNAIGTFIPFVGDAAVELIGVEAAGDGLATGRHGAPLTVGGRGGRFSPARWRRCRCGPSWRGSRRRHRSRSSRCSCGSRRASRYGSPESSAEPTWTDRKSRAAARRSPVAARRDSQSVPAEQSWQFLGAESGLGSCRHHSAFRLGHLGLGRKLVRLFRGSSAV